MMNLIGTANSLPKVSSGTVKVYLNSPSDLPSNDIPSPPNGCGRSNSNQEKNSFGIKT